jgi:hypothetical protein
MKDVLHKDVLCKMPMSENVDDKDSDEALESDDLELCISKQVD